MPLPKGLVAFSSLFGGTGHSSVCVCFAAAFVVSVSSPVSYSWLSFLSTFDAMMEMCIPGGLLIQTQEIRLLISSKHHSLSLFSKGKYVAGVCPKRTDLPHHLPKSCFPPAVRENYQSRGCEVHWKSLSSCGNSNRCIFQSCVMSRH